MPSRVAEITEMTKVEGRIVWVGILSAIALTGAFTTLNINASSALTRVEALEKDRLQRREDYVKTIVSIDARLGRIEDKMGIRK